VLVRVVFAVVFAFGVVVVVVVVVGLLVCGWVAACLLFPKSGVNYQYSTVDVTQEKKPNQIKPNQIKSNQMFKPYLRLLMSLLHDHNTTTTTTMPHTYLIQLPDIGTLRVRMPGPYGKCRGSMTLAEPDAVYELLWCREYKTEVYTEANWLERYAEMYGLDEKHERKKLFKLNSNPEETRYKMPEAEGSRCLIHADHCLLSKQEVTRFDLVQWDRESLKLKLHVSDDIPSGKHSVARTEYTSLLLEFERLI
jgi:hypothetical protein